MMIKPLDTAEGRFRLYTSLIWVGFFVLLGPFVLFIVSMILSFTAYPGLMDRGSAFGQKMEIVLRVWLYLIAPVILMLIGAAIGRNAARDGIGLRDAAGVFFLKAKLRLLRPRTNADIGWIIGFNIGLYILWRGYLQERFSWVLCWAIVVGVCLFGRDPSSDRKR